MKRRKHDRHEPKLSQEDWDAILDSAIASSSRTRRPRQRDLNPILKEYLLQHRVLVQYLHDVYGFRRGVLVATGKNRMGWSSVSDHDVEIRRIDPLKLPALQKLVKKGASIPEITSHKAYRKAIKGNCAIPVPIFDFNIGIFLAIGRAEQGALQTKPKNRNLNSAIQKMRDKASRHFGREPYSEVTL